MIYINCHLCKNRKLIVFVCVENAGRSLMAEAFLKKYAPHCMVSSAGTQPAEKPNDTVVQAMREINIDITAKKPQRLTDDMIDGSSHIVNMGCMDAESCPALFVNDVTEWSIPDPRGKSLDEVRKIRDIIKGNVKDMAKSL